MLAGFRKVSGGRALVERFGIPRGKKLGRLSLGQRSTLGMIVGLAARAPVTLLAECHWGGDAGPDLGPVARQDLFVHLTQPSGGSR